jgi:hypothetical protein
MAGDLNAKHVAWISRLTTRRGKFLRDYADENSCLIFGPDTQTTNPYNLSATPDVLDIAVTKELLFPVYLTSCCALSSDPALKAEVNRLLRSVTRRLNKWRNDHWSTTLESRRPITVEVDQAGDESPYSVSPLITTRGIALSGS